MANKKGPLSHPPLELQQLIARPELRARLQQQLQKDLGCECSLSLWQEELPAILEDMAAQKILSATLYRIDLSESEYGGSMKNSQPWHKLALAVMKREAQKVLLRDQFS